MDIFGDTDPARMPAHFFYGAKRLMTTAQRADVSKQNYSVVPRHWYITAVIRCCSCGEEFVFTASEQRFWYEERRFYVDSFPNRCPACRKRERTMLELRQQYDSLIAAAVEPCPTEQKLNVIRMINELEAMEEDVPERMKKNRELLVAQMRNCEQ